MYSVMLVLSAQMAMAGAAITATAEEATPVMAQAATPGMAEPAAIGRYQLLAVDGGFVRLDTVTGDMEYCGNGETAPDCKPLGVKPAAANAVEMAAEIANLKARVERLERISAQKTSPSNYMDEQDFNRALSMMEKAMRRFMGIAKEFDQQKAL
jgi:hypothetical protein